ncbi:hypothetical protein ACFPN2_34450 [Steroidobacter flavus]|uniref:Uncharacterized protein n=1 Tax=Steroidobacter flavus TaxID=1842136 RepID=A0ABV8T3I3_9GAMM
MSGKPGVGDQAVLYPLLSRGAFTAIVVLSLATIAAAVLLLPTSLEACQRSCGLWEGLSAAARIFRGVEGMADASRFPLAAAIGHFSVLVLGVAGGVCLAITRFEKVNVAAGVNAGGWGGRILRVLAVALVAAQFFVAPPEMNEHQFSYGFFEAVSHERDTFLLWMAGIYLGTLAVVLCLAVELSELISRRRKWLR